MPGDAAVAVLRLGHRPGRDDRMTTHVGLTARAFGADRVILPADATGAADTVRDVTDRFGGPFAVETTAGWRATLRGWPGVVAHLTMYGDPLPSVLPGIRDAAADTDLLVVVGAAKVPGDVYERATWNVGVTDQPHSEVAALAVFLDRLTEGAALEGGRGDDDRGAHPRSGGGREA